MKEASRSSYTAPAITMMVAAVRPGILSSRALAVSTMRCYAGINHYPLYYHFFDFNGSTTLNARFHDGASHAINGDWDSADAIRRCRRNGSIDYDAPAAYTAMLFYRHCLTLRYLVEHDTGIGNSWVLSIDADIGVVDPRHRIEEWIDNDVDLIFYERDWTWETMAGSYLVRNTPQAHAFLSRWIDHHDELIAARRPNRNHDQSSLQTMLMRWFATPSEQAICERYYDAAVDWSSYHIFLACCRHFIYQHAATSSSKNSAGVLYFTHGGTGLRIKLLRRWHPAWSRDALARVSVKWSPSWDFMLHEWKDTRRRPSPAFPNPDFNQLDPLSEWEAPFNDAIIIRMSPSELESDCVPKRREEIMHRYWFDIWRRDLMLSGSEMKKEFDKAGERLNQMYAGFCESANLSNSCAFS